VGLMGGAKHRLWGHPAGPANAEPSGSSQVDLAHIRSHGCHDLIAHCNSGHCHHGARFNVDWLANEWRRTQASARRATGLTRRSRAVCRASTMQSLRQTGTGCAHHVRGKQLSVTAITEGGSGTDLYLSQEENGVRTDSG
jgi:hypothetical protein